MLEPSPNVPLRTVESPMIHSVGKAGRAGRGGEYRPLPGAPLGAGPRPIWVSRGTSPIWRLLSLTYFASAVVMALPCAESSGKNGLFWNALRPETMEEATKAAPGRYV